MQLRLVSTEKLPTRKNSLGGAHKNISALAAGLTADDSMLIGDIGGQLLRVRGLSSGDWETGPTVSGLSITPWHLSVNSGKIYLADRDARRIVRMEDVAGAGWTAFSGIGANQLSTNGFVMSVAVDAMGRIYITVGSSLVRINDMDGTGWVKLGPTPSGSGSFIGPKNIIFDQQGRILVTDELRNRIDRLDDISGAGWTTFGSLGAGFDEFEGTLEAVTTGGAVSAVALRYDNPGGTVFATTPVILIPGS